MPDEDVVPLLEEDSKLPAPPVIQVVNTSCNTHYTTCRSLLLWISRNVAWYKVTKRSEIF